MKLCKLFFFFNFISHLIYLFILIFYLLKSWHDIKVKFEDDHRYKVIESSRVRFLLDFFLFFSFSLIRIKLNET